MTMLEKACRAFCCGHRGKCFAATTIEKSYCLAPALSNDMRRALLAAGIPAERIDQ